MKQQFFITLASIFLVIPISNAQNNKTVIFNYRCVPTSTTDYAIEITNNKFVLTQTEKTPKRGTDRIRKTATSNYTYSFEAEEKRFLDSIITKYHLDSIDLYKEKKTEWGTQWVVEVQENAIKNTIQLPNYSNDGLASMLQFIVCLIPTDKIPHFMCKKCL